MIRSRSTYGRFRPRATAIRRTADPDRRTAPPAPVILCRRGPAFRRGRRARADRVGPADCRRGCSASDTSGGRGDVRLEQERARVALAGALEIETMEPDRDGRRRPDAPWCSPRQETSAFLRRQLGDTFQVQVDAGLERRDDRRERLAVYGDVEIKADGVPLLAASVGITPQSGHVDSASPRLSGRRSGGVAPVLPAVDAPFEPGESIAEVPHVGAEVPHVGAQPREQGDQQAGREPRLEPVGHVRKLSQRACAVKRRPGPGCTSDFVGAGDRGAGPGEIDRQLQ